MCEVHGCSNPNYKPKGKWKRAQQVCFKHWIARKSGRVGSQWKRDIHNFHRKGKCECCGKTAYQCGVETINSQWYKEPVDHLRVRDIMRIGMQALSGDHINGRDIERAHYPENIQTLCFHCHRIKSNASGDHRPVMHR